MFSISRWLSCRKVVLVNIMVDRLTANKISNVIDIKVKKVINYDVLRIVFHFERHVGRYTYIIMIYAVYSSYQVLMLILIRYRYFAWALQLVWPSWQSWLWRFSFVEVDNEGGWWWTRLKVQNVLKENFVISSVI